MEPLYWGFVVDRIINDTYEQLTLWTTAAPQKRRPRFPRPPPRVPKPHPRATRLSSRTKEPRSLISITSSSTIENYVLDSRNLLFQHPNLVLDSLDLLLESQNLILEPPDFLLEQKNLVLESPNLLLKHPKPRPRFPKVWVRIFHISIHTVHNWGILFSVWGLIFIVKNPLYSHFYPHCSQLKDISSVWVPIFIFNFLLSPNVCPQSSSALVRKSDWVMREVG